MPDISTTMIKQLRQRTGAGVMDCKSALAEANGNEDEAVKIIQKKGLAKVVKRAGAIATEGAIHAYVHPGSRLGVLVEVNCQTDFVGRGEDFKAFVELVGMQIASMNPLFVRREEITQPERNERRELFAAQVREEQEKSGKKRPENVVDKIVDGKLEKWINEVCLVEQASVLDNEKTIGQLADDLSVKTGEKISIRRFVRYELGEGFQEKKADLASEVAEVLSQ
ncbi:MAG: elongation factor Ts [Deltaproteobacteria bacterium]|nr:elongation factor Ts [Deltaproteobacteria bacterium]